jgi:hypothetical protein
MRYGCWIGFAGPRGLGVRMCFKGTVIGVVGKEVWSVMEEMGMEIDADDEDVGLVEMCRKVFEAGDSV